jgi:RND superfamily putative drug exporter
VFVLLGRLVTRRPWYVIGAWLLFAVLVVALAPKLEPTSDQSEFLPDSYESIKTFERLAEDFPGTNTSIGATVVFDRPDGELLTDEDLAAANAVLASLGDGIGDTFDGFLAPVPDQPDLVVVPSEGREIAYAQLLLSPDSAGFEPEALDDARELRTAVRAATEGTGLEVGLTGNVPNSVDNEDAAGDALLIVGVATIALIVVLLALIFRSVLICLLPVVVIGLLTFVATGLIGAANAAFDLKADSSVEQILVVVLYGVGTDYILFFLFRYRERIREGEDKRSAVEHALERAGEAIASAGGAVIVAFLALLLSSLGVFRAIGPAMAIAVAVTLVASLTLVPAIVTLLGARLFWPSKKYMVEPESARFEAIGHSLGSKPLRATLASGGVLALLGVFALSFNPSFDFSGSSVPKDAESVVAGDKFAEHVSAGAGDPSIVLLHSTDGEPIGEEQITAFVAAISASDGVQTVVPALSNDAGTSHLFSVLLDAKPDGDEAIADIRDSVRPNAHAAAPEGTEALVGGNTAVFVDFEKAMNRDYKVVFPVAAGVIILILALLLRSLVAPIYLMVSVGLGFAATLGATALVFQNLKGEDGLIFILPMYIYLFVVALGTDYNILMIARLREEAREGLSPRDAAAEAVKHSGPTIAAAGVILAGTFASLLLAGNSLLVSMGFAISLGILIAAFVMAMFFTPALTALLGHAAWWPGHGDEKKAEKVQEPVA